MTESAVIELKAHLGRDAVRDVLQRVERETPGPGQPVILDLAAVDSFDSAGLGAVIEGMRSAKTRGVDVRLKGLSQPMLEFFSLVSVERLMTVKQRRPKLSPVTRLGGAVEPMWQTASGVVSIACQAARSVAAAPLRVRLDRTVGELDQTGNGALPIVGLIAFLLGLVLAMQAYVQLRVWGAEIYMADMVGVSVTSEIGPLMTAIILAARSGSSNAAQLGSMVIGEEIDALEQMGVQPVRYLVVPKVLALAFATVALGLVFDAVAIAGGALFALSVAGIEPGAYLEQTRGALHLDEFVIGKLKCVVFGTCIGLVSCGLGLRVEGGSEGVARATTKAVVASIFLIIVIDSIFVSVQRLVMS